MTDLIKWRIEHKGIQMLTVKGTLKNTSTPHFEIC